MEFQKEDTKPVFTGEVTEEEDEAIEPEFQRRYEEMHAEIMEQAEVVEEGSEDLLELSPEEIDKIPDVDLSFEQIANVNDIEEKRVPIPEWGGYVTVQSMTMRQFEDVRRRATNQKTGIRNEELLKRYMLMTGLKNPEINDKQYNVLMNKSSSAIVRIVQAINEVSGFTKKGMDEAEGRFPKR